LLDYRRLFSYSVSFLIKVEILGIYTYWYVFLPVEKCIITFTNLKAGSYAIRYFHDENSNKELDTKFLGIPKEGIGFSNDAYGKFGPKDFKHWLFEVKGNTQIKLITTYY
jgi:uncharacterized protein (DUF2141 family)